MKIRIYLAVSLLIPLLAVVGCATYGSRLVMVTLKTEPERHANAFIVPIDDWERITNGQRWAQPYEPTNRESFRQSLEPWRIQNQRTPVQTLTFPYRQVYLVEWTNHYWWATFNFSTQRECTIQIDYTAIPQELKKKWLEI